MLLDWASHGYQSELDLFITRSILWLIAKQNLRDANDLFSNVQSQLEAKGAIMSSPLFHFDSFILQTVTRDAAPLFNLLKEKYTPELERDPALLQTMEKIGEVYFGIKPKGSLFSDMLKMFSGM
ncbi:uncharacterized protein [Blastocystis hominis]|uniref:Uncharacterized protein n=1 Tax=Blastocystis hominis TaxID=12968 RepID=D8M9U2_BLAHO|nr:uncharacterized protein [Blastocystis hominis]CBK24831.2 unnamed protein product [Blastocystis hominis]|eukprot:XP_012898879.1 uncharacterized protein [Blastocystis hominis]